MKILKAYAVILAVALLASACGGGDKTGSNSGGSPDRTPHAKQQPVEGNPGQVPSQNPNQPYPYSNQYPSQNNQQPSGFDQNGGYYYQNYEFNQNGCSTGPQSFTAATQEEALRDLCAALLSESLNHGCAREARVELYHAQCGNNSGNGGMQSPFSNVF